MRRWKNRVGDALLNFGLNMIGFAITLWFLKLVGVTSEFQGFIWFGFVCLVGWLLIWLWN